MGTVNKGGRPQKFDENELLQKIENYINNEHDKEKEIKITILAKNLQDKGLNIVYQDLNRYSKVKDFIVKYNAKFKSKKEENNIDSAKKGVSGRPRKFNEDELLIAVKGYVKHLKIPELIKVTKVAKYFQSKGIKITYQDLRRYKKVNEFIEDYNQKYKDTLFAGLVDTEIEKHIPIFEHIDALEFLKSNKTPEQVEKALKILNQTNEKLVESYEKLQNKIIIQNDKIIKQYHELESLKHKMELLKLEGEKREEELKYKIKKLKNNVLLKARKMAMYEEFIHKYHYSSLAEYAINLEYGGDNESLNRFGDFFNEKSYIKGDFKLKNVVDKYISLNLTIDNTEEEYFEEYEYNGELSKYHKHYSYDLKDYIDVENNINIEEIENDNIDDIKRIDSLNLTIEDIDTSLSFLDEV